MPLILPICGSAFDARISIVLGPGNYRVAIGQFDNFPLGPTLANGFLETGANFAGNILLHTPAFPALLSSPSLVDVAAIHEGRKRVAAVFVEEILVERLKVRRVPDRMRIYPLDITEGQARDSRYDRSPCRRKPHT